MPKRVVDGIVSETLRRPLWCVAAPSLDRMGARSELLSLLSERGRDVALLDTRAGAATALANGQARFRSVTDACDRMGVSPSDAVLVCGDPATDVRDFAPDGARVVVVNPHARPVRGTIALHRVDELRGLFEQTYRYQAGSTYHEV